MEFVIKEILEDLKREDFEKVWRKWSNKIPKEGVVNLPKDRGKSHIVNDILFKIREGLLELGFEEVINPIIIEEVEVYKQYGPEAPIILDRVYYLAGLPRPDIGLDSKIIEKIVKEVGEINIEKLKRILREYREGKINADELIETFKVRLNLDDRASLKLIEIFKPFFKLEPIPSRLTLRSHMTGAWFQTIREILEYRDPPLYLFSIDWVFRREQREDPLHLRYYHSVSVVVVDPQLNDNYAFELTKTIVNKIQEKLNLKFEGLRIRKKRDTARYYALDREWEVYIKFKNRDHEIGTFGFYNPISLAKEGIPYPVYNFGLGLERIAQVVANEEDIRRLVFRHRYYQPTDEEIAKRIEIIKEPKTEWGKRLVPILVQLIERYKDRIGPFKELVYQDERVKIYFMEPDENKKFVGKATFNKVYVKDGNIISSLEDIRGVYLGRYIDLIMKKIVAEIEEGKKGLFKVRWIDGLSDINLQVPEKLLKWMNEHNKKIDVGGPVFLDIYVE